MTKIPPKPKKITEIPLKPKKIIDKNPWNPNYDQNTAKHVRQPKYTWNI